LNWAYLNKFNTCVLPPYCALEKAPLVVEVVVGLVVLGSGFDVLCVHLQ